MNMAQPAGMSDRPAPPDHRLAPPSGRQRRPNGFLDLTSCYYDLEDSASPAKRATARRGLLLALMVPVLAVVDLGFLGVGLTDVGTLIQVAVVFVVLLTVVPVLNKTRHVDAAAALVCAIVMLAILGSIVTSQVIDIDAVDAYALLAIPVAIAVVTLRSPLLALPVLGLSLLGILATYIGMPHDAVIRADDAALAATSPAWAAALGPAAWSALQHAIRPAAIMVIVGAVAAGPSWLSARDFHRAEIAEDAERRTRGENLDLKLVFDDLMRSLERAKRTGELKQVQVNDQTQHELGVILNYGVLPWLDRQLRALRALAAYPDAVRGLRARLEAVRPGVPVRATGLAARPSGVDDVDQLERLTATIIGHLQERTGGQVHAPSTVQQLGMPPSWGVQTTPGHDASSRPNPGNSPHASGSPWAMPTPTSASAPPRAGEDLPRDTNGWPVLWERDDGR